MGQTTVPIDRRLFRMRDQRPSRQSAIRNPKSELAFTLVELIVSLAIMSIIMASIGSAVMLAAQAMPDDNHPGDDILAQAEAGLNITDELAVAQYILEAEDHAVTFTVSDRDGDRNPERIRYAWSGTPGDPLTRQYNDGEAVAIQADVQQFDLTYTTVTHSETYPGGPVESSEQLLASWDHSYDLGERTVEDDDWWAQAIQPSLASDVLSWSIQRVFIDAKRAKPWGVTAASLTTTGGDGNPTGDVLGITYLDNATLGNGWNWRQLDFTNVDYLMPGQAVSLVLGANDESQQLGEGEDEDEQHKTLQFRYVGEPSSAGAMRRSRDAGGSWSTESGDSMRYSAYGKVTTQGPDQTVHRDHLTSVRVQLTGSSDTATIDTAVPLLNTPQVVDAVWELDFDSDPTSIDLDADGNGDWVRSDGSGGISNLSGGVWYTNSEGIETRPLNPLNQLTTAEVRFKATSNSGDGAVVWINADFTGSQGAPVIAMLQLEADNTQTLTLYRMSGSSLQVLTTLESLPADFVTMRLLIDPAEDFVNIQVNDADFGTYAYKTVGVSASDQVTALGTSNSTNAQFDWARIVVGGY